MKQQARHPSVVCRGSRAARVAIRRRARRTFIPPMSSSVRIFNLQRRSYWVGIATLAVLIALDFGPRFRWLWEQWTSDGLYSFSILVPFIVAALVGRKLRLLESVEDTPRWWGLLLFSATVLVTAVLDRYGVILHALTPALLILAISGAIITLRGCKTVRILWFELAFLLFLLPVPADILFVIDYPLQELGARITTGLAHFTGLHVVRHGAMVLLRDSQAGILVAPQCNGVRSIVSMVATALVYVYLCDGPLIRRWVMLIAAVPIAYAANMARLYNLIFMASWFGSPFMNIEHYWDLASGFLIFGGAILVFFSLAKVLGCNRLIRSPRS
jgi:exosortase